jgi:hypothetical protein
MIRSLRFSSNHFQLRVLKMNLIVRDGGQIAIGDSVLVPRSMPTTLIAFPPPPAATGAQRRFMCRGCYFVYEEANGLPQQSIRPGNAASRIFRRTGAAPIPSGDFQVPIRLARWRGAPSDHELKPRSARAFIPSPMSEKPVSGRQGTAGVTVSIGSRRIDWQQTG